MSLSDTTSFYSSKANEIVIVYRTIFYTLHYGWIFHRIASDCWLCFSMFDRIYRTKRNIEKKSFFAFNFSMCSISDVFAAIYVYEISSIKISNMQYEYLQVFIEQWIWIWRGSQGSLSKNISRLYIMNFAHLFSWKKFHFFRIISIYLYRFSSFFCFISYYCEV